MLLRSGIPLLEDVQALEQEEEFRRHSEYSEAFARAYGRLVQQYGRRWCPDPLRSWSRRWEYPFAAQRVEGFARQQGNRALEILDAGSGVTYLPYFLCDRLGSARVFCCDSDRRCQGIFSRINHRRKQRRLHFVPAVIHDLPFRARSFDVVYCISVLEHTNHHDEILEEFHRVLRPGGLLVLTFGLSLDGRSNISRTAAAELLSLVDERFASDGAQWQRELDRLNQLANILTTDSVRRSRPELLPWKPRALKAIQDVLTGRGWTGGFHSLSCYCLDARAKR